MAATATQEKGGTGKRAGLAGKALDQARAGKSLREQTREAKDSRERANGSKAKPDPVPSSELRDAIKSLVQAKGTTDTKAPLTGRPFVQNDKLHLAAQALLDHMNRGRGKDKLTRQQVTGGLRGIGFESGQWVRMKVKGKHTWPSLFRGPKGSLAKGLGERER